MNIENLHMPMTKNQARNVSIKYFILPVETGATFFANLLSTYGPAVRTNVLISFFNAQTRLSFSLFKIIKRGRERGRLLGATSRHSTQYDRIWTKMTERGALFPDVLLLGVAPQAF